jgi:hypothetical protein
MFVSDRPRGGPPALARVAEEFAKQLAADFDTHGDAAIADVCRKNPAAYLRFAAAFVPKNLPPRDVLGEISDDELEAMIEHLRTRIAAEAACNARGTGR